MASDPDMGTDIRQPWLAGLSSTPLANPIPAEHLGSVTLAPDRPVTAGSYQTLAVVYTAGTYGIDDSGSLRICFRFASDQGKPQFTDPAAAGYTTVVASNGAVLDYRFDPKGNVRPWDQTLYIKVVRGYLKKGDTITVVFGARDGGSPGIRMQTFCEESYEFHVLVDPIATFTYQPLPMQPVVRIEPGPPVRFLAVLPTRRRPGEPFGLKVKGEDEWGNPSDKCDAVFTLSPSGAISGLPETLSLSPGAFAASVDGLTIAEPGDVTVDLIDASGKTAAITNPLRIAADGPKHYWADLHGQSEETIGTGSAREYFAFARDRAFVDACAHQGNDFQMTLDFWSDLNALCAEFDEPGRFVAIPGYEWSGNTALGGDRNVFFPNEGRTIRRSSHALLPDKSDLHTDALNAGELFEAFAAHGEWDVLMYAHCGGRYADIKLAHDGRFEKSVEVHSSWGTFEWLLHDALDMGYRVGIVGNSDGHKGRPGASYPGASKFGAVGGLTCFLAEELTRAAILDCIRKRHHYATTGGAGGRPVIDLAATFDAGIIVHHDDPKLGQANGRPAKRATIGDIVETAATQMTLSLDIHGSAPIEKLEIFNGRERIASIRTYEEGDLGSRIRVIWEGAEYRGRAREVIWDGTARLSGNTIMRTAPINFFNLDKRLEQKAGDLVVWQALTTGNFGGFDLWADGRADGTLTVETPLITCTHDLAEIDQEEIVHDAGGELGRRIRIFRLPDALMQKNLKLTRHIPLKSGGADNVIYIKLTQEDGTVAWTSPVYVIRTS